MVTNPDFKIMYARPVLYAVLLSTHIVIQYTQAKPFHVFVQRSKNLFEYLINKLWSITFVSNFEFHTVLAHVHVSPSNTILSPCTHFVFWTLLWRFKKCGQKTKTKPSNISVLTLGEQFASLRLNTVVYFLF